MKGGVDRCLTDCRRGNSVENLHETTCSGFCLLSCSSINLLFSVWSYQKATGGYGGRSILKWPALPAYSISRSVVHQLCPEQNQRPLASPAPRAAVVECLYALWMGNEATRRKRRPFRMVLVWVLQFSTGSRYDESGSWPGRKRDFDIKQSYARRPKKCCALWSMLMISTTWRIERILIYFNFSANSAAGPFKARTLVDLVAQGTRLNVNYGSRYQVYRSHSSIELELERWIRLNPRCKAKNRRNLFLLVWLLDSG